jgi:hypothetical protein
MVLCPIPTPVLTGSGSWGLYCPIIPIEPYGRIETTVSKSQADYARPPPGC